MTATLGALTVKTALTFLTSCFLFLILPSVVYRVVQGGFSHILVSHSVTEDAPCTTEHHLKDSTVRCLTLSKVIQRGWEGISVFIQAWTPSPHH